MIIGFHHIALNVRDLDRSRQFYAALPGFVLDQHFPGEKVRFRMGADAARLVLRPPLPGTPAGDRFTERRVGLDHVAVGVSSRAALDQILAVLRDLDVETDGIHLDRAGETGLITFRDPDNIQWEFFEQPD